MQLAFSTACQWFPLWFPGSVLNSCNYLVSWLISARENVCTCRHKLLLILFFFFTENIADRESSADDKRACEWKVFHEKLGSLY